MNDLETMLRERLRVADDVRVPLDPDAVLAAGRLARRLRTVRWVVAGVAAVLVAVVIVALVWVRLPAHETVAIPDPLGSPTAMPTPSASPSAAASATARAKPTDEVPTTPGSVRLRVLDGDGFDEVTASGHPMGFQMSAAGKAPVLVSTPSGPQVGLIRAGYPDDRWLLLAINGNVAWVAPVVPDVAAPAWFADAKVLPGTQMAAGAIRFEEPGRAATVSSVLWGDPDGNVYTFDTGVRGRRLGSTRLPSVFGGTATYAWDSALDVWVVRHPGQAATVRRPSAWKDRLPSATSTSPDNTRVETVIALPPTVDPGSLTWQARSGVTKDGAPQVAALSGGGVLVRQVWRVDGTPDAGVQVSYILAGKRITQPLPS